MKKNRLIEIIALVLTGLTAIAGLLTLPQAALLPAEWQPYIAVTLAVVLAGKNLTYVILDFADNGKLDKSYVVKLLIAAGLIPWLLPSCSTDAQGRKTFLGLNQGDWTKVGQAAGTAALKGGSQAALIEYGNRRAVHLEVTATK